MTPAAANNEPRSVTCVCGKTYSRATAQGWDARRKRCRDLGACAKRSMAGLPTTSMSPWINQRSLYDAAPKLGDA